MTAPTRSTSLIVLSIAATLIFHAAAFAQGAFPAPLPGQAAAPAAAVPPPMMAAPGPAPTQSSFPSPMSGGFSAPPPGAGGGFGAPQEQGAPPGAQECQTGFVSLRQDAEAKAKAIKVAGQRHAPPQEACKLIAAFGQSEVKMIKFIEANAQKCRIPPEAAVQMKKGHAATEQLQNKVCNAAANGGGGGGGPAPGPSLSEALGSASLPEAKATKRSGGSTFDTLSGNVLAR